jgi:putative photosynthetic complex assembly protein
MKAMTTLQTPMARGPLLALAAVAVLTVAGTAAVRWSGTTAVPAAQPTVAPTQFVRTLHFGDTADGGIAVHDARSGAVLDTLHGEQGFVRGVLRAMTRERRIRGVQASTTPFELGIAADGRLKLHDPATGMQLDLEAFGPTNAGAFARLLTL